MRILLAESRSEVRSALKLLLEEAAGLAVSHEVKNSDELLSCIDDDCPDIMFIEWELPGINGADLITMIRDKCARPIIITLHKHADTGKKAVTEGADGFICKDSLPQEVIATVIQCLEDKFPVYD